MKKTIPEQKIAIAISPRRLRAKKRARLRKKLRRQAIAEQALKDQSQPEIEKKIIDKTIEKTVNKVEKTVNKVVKPAPTASELKDQRGELKSAFNSMNKPSLMSFCNDVLEMDVKAKDKKEILVNKALIVSKKYGYLKILKKI